MTFLCSSSPALCCSKFPWCFRVIQEKPYEHKVLPFCCAPPINRRRQQLKTNRNKLKQPRLSAQWFSHLTFSVGSVACQWKVENFKLTNFWGVYIFKGAKSHHIYLNTSLNISGSLQQLKCVRLNSGEDLKGESSVSVAAQLVA